MHFNRTNRQPNILSRPREKQNIVCVITQHVHTIITNCSLALWYFTTTNTRDILFLFREKAKIELSHFITARLPVRHLHSLNLRWRTLQCFSPHTSQRTAARSIQTSRYTNKYVSFHPSLEVMEGNFSKKQLDYNANSNHLFLYFKQGKGGAVNAGQSTCA